MNIYNTLINKQNKIPEDAFSELSLVDIVNTRGEPHKVEHKTLEMFENLKRHCEEEGIFIGISYGYRSEEEQRNIYKEFSERYGEEYAKAIVAPVNTSEHQSGLAIDFAISLDKGKTFLRNKKDELLEYDNIFKKIHGLLSQYGFILRYPEGKDTITGYGYEPWHVRYVGVKTAKAISTSGLTLEEWHEQNLAKNKSMANKLWERTDKANVYIMEMPENEVENRISTMGDVDKKAVELLNRGFRITKQSAITKKGIYGIDSLNQTVSDKIAAYKRKYIKNEEAKEDNIFFEMNYDFDDIRNIYSKIGGAQNNFPQYMQSRKAYEEYKKTHDILVVEEIATNKPVGFMTRTVYPIGSEDFKDMCEDANKKINKNVLYFDTLAIDRDYLGKGLGKSLTEITDAYYLNIFKNNVTYMLTTGDINTAKGGKLSLKNHEDRGFEVVNTFVKDSSHYKKRYEDNWENKGYDNLSLSTMNSYRNYVHR